MHLECFEDPEQPIFSIILKNKTMLNASSLTRNQFWRPLFLCHLVADMLSLIKVYCHSLLNHSIFALTPGQNIKHLIADRNVSFHLVHTVGHCGCLENTYIFEVHGILANLLNTTKYRVTRVLWS